MADEPTTAQLAIYGQAHAEAGRGLDTVIDLYRRALADAEAHPAIELVGLITYLAQESDVQSLAHFLGIAVERLVRAEADHG